MTNQSKNILSKLLVGVFGLYLFLGLFIAGYIFAKPVGFELAMCVIYGISLVVLNPFFPMVFELEEKYDKLSKKDLKEER